MNNIFATQGLQFILCPGKFPDPNYVQIYNEIYNSWYKLWSSTYVELNDKTELYADTFTNQDFISAIFLDGKCLAFILYRHLDLTLQSSTQDSYFEHWNAEHLKAVSKQGQNILICGNMGIMPDARGKNLGISMKDLVLGLVTTVSLNSKADAMICTPRVDRNVNGAAYRWGATQIEANVDWGLGVAVDLTSFFKEDVIARRDHELVPLVNELWGNKLVVPQETFESVNSFMTPRQSVLKKVA